MRESLAEEQKQSKPRLPKYISKDRKAAPPINREETVFNPKRQSIGEKKIHGNSFYFVMYTVGRLVGESIFNGQKYMCG